MKWYEIGNDVFIGATTERGQPCTLQLSRIVLAQPHFAPPGTLLCLHEDPLVELKIQEPYGAFIALLSHIAQRKGEMTWPPKD